MHFTLKASPEPTIEWFKDGSPLKTSKRINSQFDGELCTLSFAEVELDDEGKYECVVRNKCGTVSAVTELLVNEAAVKPELMAKLEDIEAAEGEEVQFDVRLSGMPTPEVSWFKGSRKIENEGKFLCIDDEEDDLFSLAIEDICAEDAGTYKCVASNEAGEITCRAELRVTEKMVAPEFCGDNEAGPITVYEGGELSLNVGAKGSPKPQVEWFKEGKPLTKTSRIDMKTHGTNFSLVVVDLVPEDSGCYECVASSKAGRISRKFDVNVQGKWTIHVVQQW